MNIALPTMTASTQPVGKATTVLVTGASGFIGRALVQSLQKSEHYFVRSAVRRLDREGLSMSSNVFIGDLSESTDWQSALENVDVVIHLAGRTHVVAGKADESLAQLREVNTTATLNLAEQAVRDGARRFIFISSIKVLGETSVVMHPLKEDAPYAPADAYAVSKMEAELGLLRIARTTSMQVIIIRPPLVYGPGMQSNFGALMQAVRQGIPLPFAAIRNKRSFLGIDNLLSFLEICVDHPMVGNQIYAVSDGDDLSTPDLIRCMGAVLGRRPLLLPIPEAGLRYVASVLGKQSSYQRLCGTLQVDISKVQQNMNWHPPIRLLEGLRRVIEKGEGVEARL